MAASNLRQVENVIYTLKFDTHLTHLISRIRYMNIRGYLILRHQHRVIRHVLTAPAKLGGGRYELLKNI
jgi:hypothetical protein